MQVELKNREENSEYIKLIFFFAVISTFLFYLHQKCF